MTPRKYFDCCLKIIDDIIINISILTSAPFVRVMKYFWDACKIYDDLSGKSGERLSICIRLCIVSDDKPRMRTEESRSVSLQLMLSPPGTSSGGHLHQCTLHFVSKHHPSPVLQPPHSRASTEG